MPEADMAIKRPVAIDIFSGCGGLTEGLRQAGFRVAGAIEIDELAAKTYRANHRTVKVWNDDISLVSTEVVKKTLKIRKGQIDLVAGCPPCQGFSSMRTLNGHARIEDDRNDLIFQFLRFVEDLSPKTVMMENVPGLKDDRRFAKFVQKLKKLGYCHLKFGIHDAKHYGVPQRRRRLILLASRSRRLELPRPDKNSPTVRQFIATLPPAGKSGDAPHDLRERRTAKVRKLIARIPKDGGSRTDLPRKSQLKCHKRCNGFKDVFGRMAWDKVAPTITGGCFNPSKGRFLHPTKNRCITMREAALLQSFPVKYRFPDVSSKQAVALLIGNALPPEMIRRFARNLRKSLPRSRKTGKKCP
jgi:DNA (cytosine-5)-methyltransferase 1